MSAQSKQASLHEGVRTFYRKFTDELYGTPERARNTIGVAFLTLVILRISGYIGEAEPILGAACGL